MQNTKMLCLKQWLVITMAENPNIINLKTDQVNFYVELQDIWLKDVQIVMKEVVKEIVKEINK
jgi:hypothetical protein